MKNSQMGQIYSLKNAPVQIQAILLEDRIPIKELLNLECGSTLSFDVSIEHEALLSLNGHRFAKGKVVQVDGQYGLKITEILQ